MLRLAVVPIAVSALCLVPTQVTAQKIGGSRRWVSAESVELASMSSRDLEVLPTSEFPTGALGAAPSPTRAAAYAAIGALLGTAAGAGFGSLMVDDKGFACGNCGPIFLLGLAGNLVGVSAGTHVGAGRRPTAGGAAFGLLAGFGAYVVMANASPAVAGLVAFSVQGVLTAKSALREAR